MFFVGDLRKNPSASVPKSSALTFVHRSAFVLESKGSNIGTGINDCKIVFEIGFKK